MFRQNTVPYALTSNMTVRILAKRAAFIFYLHHFKNIASINAGWYQQRIWRMDQHKTPIYYDDNVISLTDLFNAWRKKQSLFWITFVTLTSIAVIYGFFSEQKYDLSQIIQPAGYITPAEITTNNADNSTEGSKSAITYKQPTWTPLQPNAQLITYLSSTTSNPAFKLAISDEPNTTDNLLRKQSSSSTNDYLIFQARSIKKGDIPNVLSTFDILFNNLTKLQMPYYQATRQQSEQLLSSLKKQQGELTAYHAYLNNELQKYGPATITDQQKINDQPVKALLSDTLINDLTKLPMESNFQQINFLTNQLASISLPKVLIKEHIKKVGIAKIQLFGLLIFAALIISIVITLLAAFTSNVKE